MLKISKDLKEWFVPNLWEELTLSQVNRLYNITQSPTTIFTDWMDLVADFGNIPMEEIDDWTFDDLQGISDHFLVGDLPNTWEASVEINGIEYKPREGFVKKGISAREMALIETILHNHVENSFSLIAAVLFQPEKRSYDFPDILERGKGFANAISLPFIPYFLKAGIHVAENIKN